LTAIYYQEQTSADAVMFSVLIDSGAKESPILFVTW